MTLKEQIRARMLEEQQASGQQPPSLKERVRASMSASPPPTSGIKTEIPSQNQPVTAEKPAEPWYEDLAEGVVSSGLGTVAGIADLLGYEGLNETAADWKKDAEESGWGTAGQVVGEIGQFALPAGLAAKALKGTSRLAKAAKAYQQANKLKTAIGGEAALGGVMGGVQLPQEDGDSRLTNALQGASLGAVGGAGGKLLGKAIRGAKKSKSGQELLDAGVPLSAGQQTGGVGQGLEELLAVFPLTAKKIKDMRKAGTEGYSNYVINAARPSVSKTKIKGTGPEAIQALKGQVKKGYDDAWSSADDLLEDSYGVLKQDLADGLSNLTTDERAVMNRISREIDDAFPVTQKAKKATKTKAAVKEVRTPKENAAKQIDKVISKQLKSSKDNPELVKQLQNVRSTLRSDIGEVADTALRKMDADYTKYLTVRDAADMASKGDTAGDFTAQMINSASGRYGPRGSRGMGTSPLYKEMRQGAETTDSTKIGGVLDRFRRVMQSAPTLPLIGGATESGMKAFVGGTAPQKFLQKQSKSALAEELRRLGINPTRGIQAWNE